MVRSFSRSLKLFLRLVFLLGSTLGFLTILLHLGSTKRRYRSPRQTTLADDHHSSSTTRSKSRIWLLGGQTDEDDGSSSLGWNKSSFLNIMSSSGAAPEESKPQRTLSSVSQKVRSGDAERPPTIRLPGAAAHPPDIRPIPPNHPIAEAYEQSLKEIRMAIRRLIDHDPVLKTADFKRRNAGVPGTRIETEEGREQLQSWLDCSAAEGEWRWEPMGNNLSQARPMTVHKQGPLEAKCDREFYMPRSGNGERAAGVDSSASAEEEDFWDVRPSLKYRWYPSRRCDSLKPAHVRSSLISRRDLCGLLRHKSILIVGDISQYAMHDLFLDWTSTKQVTCYGNMYCNSHAICGNELKENWKGNYSLLEDGVLDDSVYQKLPIQPMEKKTNLSNHDYGSLESLNPVIKQDFLQPRSRNNNHSSEPPFKRHGTVLRYRRSDSLWGASSTTHQRFQPIWRHPNTGIRDINNHWLSDSRRSDVVILSRAPLPMPIRSHWKNAFGRIETDLPISHLQYLTKVSKNKSWPKDFEKNKVGIESISLLIKLAKRMVLEVWLPEVLYTLLNVRNRSNESNNGSTLIIWRGEWRIQIDCDQELELEDDTLTNEERSKLWDLNNWWNDQSKNSDGPLPYLNSTNLLTILFPKISNQINFNSNLIEDGNHIKIEELISSHLKDNDDDLIKTQRNLFHNLQIIYQNLIMKQLSQPFGILFLDIESLTSIWKSGLIGGINYESNHNDQRQKKKKKKKKNCANCFQYCFPSPGLSIEESFVGGLIKIFKTGWDYPN